MMQAIKLSKLKHIARVLSYKKAMGLPDEMSNEESAQLIGEYLKRADRGIHYFEKTGVPIYGAGFNSPLRCRDLEHKMTYKFLAAEMFEKKVIFDFSYDPFMNKREKHSLVYQLLGCLGLNNKNQLPFPLMFANLDTNSFAYQQLHDYFFPKNRKLNPGITITDKSYLDLLPREEIIYLSPHAEESLNEFKHDYHYVIGCFIDISFSKQLSYKKALAEGVKCYKLPIDEFVSYSKAHNKLLPLPIVFQILLDKKRKLDWKYTLECNLGSKRLEIEMDELNEFNKKYQNARMHCY